MKRIIALLLCLVMTAGLLGCTPDQGEDTSASTLKVGFGRKKISNATGIDVNNIMVHATHSLSTPRIQGDEPIIEKYNDFLQEQMVAAAEAAVADLKPAEMYTASTTVNNVNFVRHYRMDDGSVIGSNFGDPSGNVKIIGNEGNNLWLDHKAELFIGEEGLGEEAQIGISMTNPGEFLSNVPADVDITKYFVSDDVSKKIVSTGDGSWGLK